jgi:hypothetical protein
MEGRAKFPLEAVVPPRTPTLETRRDAGISFGDVALCAHQFATKRGIFTCDRRVHDSREKHREMVGERYVAEWDEAQGLLSFSLSIRSEQIAHGPNVGEVLK